MTDVLAQFLSKHNSPLKRVCREFISHFGSLQPSNLNSQCVAKLNAWLEGIESPFTKQLYALGVKRILRHLHFSNGAKPLHLEVVYVPKPKPRNVTATTEERAAILNAAPPHLRCWLLLCSDLAIRSGTAARLTPENYDKGKGILTFRTKYQNAQRIPVTQELRVLLDLCTEQDVPFVCQLPRGVTSKNRTLHPLCRADVNRSALNHAFVKLRHKLGIERKLTPHDLRRTTARNFYSITGDLRKVSALLGHSDLNSTVWYLQDALTEVPLEALELAKLNPITEKVQ